MKNLPFASHEAYVTFDAATGSTQADPPHPPQASDGASASPPSQATPLQIAQAVFVSIHDVATCDDVSPQNRAVGAHMLLDELARVLVRVVIDLQPDDFHNLPEREG